MCRFKERRNCVMSYAGDVSCKECFSALQQNQHAQLIDVRTMPEWIFVGVPDLHEIGKQVHTIEWQQFPHMQVNTEFTHKVETVIEDIGADKDAEIYCLCRSGVRSIAAAQALTAAGFTKAYNVLAGFEGDHNHEGRRGTVAGWKFDQLPWAQR